MESKIAYSKCWVSLSPVLQRLDVKKRKSNWTHEVQWRGGEIDFVALEEEAVCMGVVGLYLKREEGDEALLVEESKKGGHGHMLWYSFLHYQQFFLQLLYGTKSAHRGTLKHC